MATGAVVAALAGFRGALFGASITSLLAGAACAVTHFGIDPKIVRMRAAMGGPVDALPPNDPRRVAFGLMHGYSVAGLTVAMLAAVVALGFLIYALRAPRPLTDALPLSNGPAHAST